MLSLSRAARAVEGVGVALSSPTLLSFCFVEGSGYRADFLPRAAAMGCIAQRFGFWNIFIIPNVCIHEGFGLRASGQPPPSPLCYGGVHRRRLQAENLTDYKVGIRPFESVQILK